MTFSSLFGKGLIFHSINWPQKVKKHQSVLKAISFFHNTELVKDKCISKAQQIPLIAALVSHNYQGCLQRGAMKSR